MKTFLLLLLPLLLASCLDSKTRVSLFKNAITTPGYSRPNTPDPLKSFVTVLIQGTGANGSTAVTNYVDGSALTPNHLFVIDTSIFPSGAMTFNGIESKVTGIPAAALEIGTGSFCFEAFVTTPATGNDNYEILFDTAGNGSGAGGFFIELSSVRGLGIISEYVGFSSNVYPTDGLEHHWMVSRDNAGNVLIGLDGVIIATGTLNHHITSNPVGGTIGNYSDDHGYLLSEGFNGSVRGVRLTIGDQRYTGSYTVPFFPLDY